MIQGFRPPTPGQAACPSTDKLKLPPSNFESTMLVKRDTGLIALAALRQAE